MVFYAWIDIKFLILSIFNFKLWKLIFNINRFQGQTSFPTAPPPTCPPDKPRVYCFVDPCQVTTCPAHPEARCVSDFCGGCNARFFDDEGNEVTKSCSKYGYSMSDEVYSMHHISLFPYTHPWIFWCWHLPQPSFTLILPTKDSSYSPLL